MTDRETLQLIRDRYGAMLEAAAAQFRHRAEVLAGIMMRETRGGTSRLLVDLNHTPDNPADDLGDQGHGHGLMQIDDRSFREFCLGEDWKDPAKNILQAARVLDGKRRYIAQAAVKANMLELSLPELERASVAAYNAGEGRIFKSWLDGEDLDVHTAGRDYSRCVLEYAEVYAEICRTETLPAEEPKLPDPAPEAPQSASTGFFTSLLQFIIKLFPGKKAANDG